MAVTEKIRPLWRSKQKQAARYLEWLTYFAAGFAVSLGSVTGDIRPFGIALVAVSKKKCILFSALGAALGYLTGGLDAAGARYLAGVVLAALGALASDGFDLGSRPYFGMTVAFLSDIAGGAVVCVRTGAPLFEYLLLLGEAVLCSGGAFFFYKALTSNYKRLRFRALPPADVTCIVISLSIVLMNLSSVYIGIVCPARLLAVFCVLCAVRFGGERWGVMLALCFGFVLGIAKAGAPFLLGALAFSALVSSLFVPLSAWGIGGSFLCCVGFFCAAWADKPALSFFAESAAAVLSFVLLPSRLTARMEAWWDSTRPAAPDGSLRQSLVLKLRFASTAMAAISESVEQVRERINEITRRENETRRMEMTDEEYMRREIVLEKTNQIRMVASDQFFSIADMLEDLAFEFDEAEIFDVGISSKIRRLLGEYDIYPTNISAIEDKYSRMRVEILTDGTAAGLDNPALQKEIGKICSRYFDKGRITNFKDETMLSFSERANYRLNVGFAQYSAEGALCGDTVKTFCDNKGHTVLIVSDGMGKGSRAALDGAMGAGLLARLINAGFGFDSALKVVNSALLVKSNDESLATLDIANIDLFTGKCEMFKAGAPAGYILKNGNVTKCELSSMPAGILRGVEFAKRTAVLTLGDRVVLMSDGIGDFGDTWIEKMLCETADKTPQESADCILQAALEQSETTVRDDMTIVVASLERN